jgi:hypothetical protein
VRVQRARLRGAQRGYRPDARPVVLRLALGGHAFVLACEQTPTAPAVWRCVRCHGHAPHFALVEHAWCRYMPYRCTGVLRALDT